MKKSYLGAQPAPRKHANRILAPSASGLFKNPFNRDDSKVYQSLGDKILSATLYGENVGIEISPTFNGNDTDDFDVLTSFTHDNFDIAEHYGKLPSPTEEVAPKLPVDDVE